MPAQPLFDDTFLRAQWGGEFEAFQASPASAALLARLRAWGAREQLNERASETAFIQRFFVETWGYTLQGEATAAYTCRPQFYREYRDYRQFVFRTLVEANPGFSGTRGRLVRLTQRFLDRCIFILFCEDMGRVLRYPPELLRDLLIEESQSRFYNPEGSGAYNFGLTTDVGARAISLYNLTPEQIAMVEAV